MNRRTFLALLAATSVSPLMSALPSQKTFMDAKRFTSMRRFASLSFGRIAYVECGHGTVALFLHGFLLNGFQWRGMLDGLAKHRRCIAPDLMGMGYSEVPEEQPITPETQVEMLASFLNELKIKDVDIIANDSGGLVAQLFIAKYPWRVKSLLLTNCDIDQNNPPVNFQPAVALAKRGLFTQRFIEPQWRDKTLARSPKGIGGQFTYPNLLADETLDFYLAPLVSTPLRMRQLDAYTAALGTNLLVAVRELLHAWNKPARLVWALKDSFFDIQTAEWLSHMLPNCRGIRRLNNANLFFPEEMPDLMCEEAKLLWRMR